MGEWESNIYEGVTSFEYQGGVARSEKNFMNRTAHQEWTKDAAQLIHVGHRGRESGWKVGWASGEEMLGCSDRGREFFRASVENELEFLLRFRFRRRVATRETQRAVRRFEVQVWREGRAEAE